MFCLLKGLSAAGIEIGLCEIEHSPGQLEVLDTFLLKIGRNQRPSLVPIELQLNCLKLYSLYIIACLVPSIKTCFKR